MKAKEDWLDRQVVIWLDYIFSSKELTWNGAFVNYWRGILLPIWLIRAVLR
jgi:hypothetical protein